MPSLNRMVENLTTETYRMSDFQKKIVVDIGAKIQAKEAVTIKEHDYIEQLYGLFCCGSSKAA